MSDVYAEEVEASQYEPTQQTVEVPPPPAEMVDQQPSQVAWQPQQRPPAQLVQRLVGFDDAGQPIYSQPEPRPMRPWGALLLAAGLGVAATFAARAMLDRA